MKIAEWVGRAMVAAMIVVLVVMRDLGYWPPMVETLVDTACVALFALNVIFYVLKVGELIERMKSDDDDDDGVTES